MDVEGGHVQHHYRDIRKDPLGNAECGWHGHLGEGRWSYKHQGLCGMKLDGVSPELANTNNKDIADGTDGFKKRVEVRQI